MVSTITRVSAVLLLLTGFQAAFAAPEPASGTLSPASPHLEFTGALFVSNGGVAPCDRTVGTCDYFDLTLDIPATYLSANPGAKVRIALSFGAGDDYDLYLLDSNEETITSSAGGSNPEVIETSAPAGPTQDIVRIDPWLVTGSTYTVTIDLVGGGAAPGNPDDDGDSVANADDQCAGTPAGTAVGSNGCPLVSSGPLPRFVTYLPPDGVALDAGEPSIGYNEATGRAMFISYTTTLQVEFPDRQTPALPQACDAHWKDVSAPTTSVISLDPILWTDQATGRTFVSQLVTTIAAGVGPGAGHSLFAFTDTDGEGGETAWTPGQIGLPTSGYDHQTVGSGPYPASVPLGSPLNNDRAVYYCSQGGVDAYCSRSDDGGQTFGSGIPIQILECGGLHGHVKVGPEGNVYVPDFQCGDTQGLIVSGDAGLSWAVRPVTGTTSTSTYDPSVGVATDGTVYFCTVEDDGSVTATVSKDAGQTWINHRNIGAALGVRNGAFPQAVAGDPDRAACAFLGTSEPGNSGAMDFAGVWYGYIATTYDGGDTWTTVNVTPNQPVQREGGICISGSGCSGNNRNLLDFNEVTRDEKGKVLFGWADGCTGPCEMAPPNNFTQVGRITRQTGGKTLLAAYDGEQRSSPDGACLSGSRDPGAAHLQWRAPADDGGKTITAYRIYRGTSSENLVLLAETGPKASYEDASADPAVEKYVYVVRAVAGGTEGDASNPVELAALPPVEPQSACLLPGITVLTDPEADENAVSPELDIRGINLAEPQSADGKLITTLKMQGLSTVAPGQLYAVRLKTATPPANGDEDYFVGMLTTSSPPRFVHGTTAVVDAGATGVRTFFVAGDLDEASGYSPDGSIVMIAPLTVIGSPAPGATLTGITASVRTTASTGEAPIAGNAVDTTGDGTYVMRAADACIVPNTAPIAALFASTQSGIKPLDVVFDASHSSDGDVDDSVASYTLDFGDGSDPVTQGQPAFTHTYDEPGLFQARLTVTDSHGTPSDNVAQVQLQVFNTGAQAHLSGSPLSGAAPLDVALDGSASTDAFGQPLSGYLFDFGDGSTDETTDATVVHRYATPGTYVASLQVRDAAGEVSDQSELVTITVSGSSTPTPTPGPTATPAPTGSPLPGGNGGGGSGAAGLGLLLPLAALALLRRRRAH